jgi:hypothetical protein
MLCLGARPQWDRWLFRAPLLGLSLATLIAENLSWLGINTATAAHALALWIPFSLWGAWRRRGRCPSETSAARHTSWLRPALFASLAPLLFAVHLAWIPSSAFSGFQNPDNFNQTANALHLIGHSLRDPVAYDPLHSWTAPLAAYQEHGIRMGSSLNLALAATWLRSDPQEVFFVLDLLALVFLFGATYEASRYSFAMSSRASLLAGAMAARHGIFAYLLFHAGLPFPLSFPLYILSLAFLFRLLRRPETARWPPGALVLHALFLAAAVSIYPEFFPLFGAIALLAWLGFGLRRWRLTLTLGCIWALATLALNPIRTLLLPSVFLDANSR